MIPVARKPWLPSLIAIPGAGAHRPIIVCVRLRVSLPLPRPIVRNSGPLEAPRRAMLCRSRTLTAKASRKPVGATAGARDQGRHGEAGRCARARATEQLRQLCRRAAAARRPCGASADRTPSCRRARAVRQKRGLFMAASFSANDRRHELIGADAVFPHAYFFPPLTTGLPEGPARDCTAPQVGRKLAPYPAARSIPLQARKRASAAAEAAPVLLGSAFAEATKGRLRSRPYGWYH